MILFFKARHSFYIEKNIIFFTSSYVPSIQRLCILNERQVKVNFRCDISWESGRTVTFQGPIRSFNVEENHNGRVVSKILQKTHPDRIIYILLLFFLHQRLRPQRPLEALEEGGVKSKKQIFFRGDLSREGGCNPPQKQV